MNAPAADAPLTLNQLPLFPLQTVLFPEGVLPLRIFEVRYLDMIRRCHQAGAPFGVVCLTEGGEVRRRDPNAPSGRDGFVREAFFPVGTLARIDHVEIPQPGLMLIQCRGTQRFHIERSHRLSHGLWIADVRLDVAEPTVAIPDHLNGVRLALQRVAQSLQQREQRAGSPLPLPHRWDDCGWVANRWAELLPLPRELKHRLMALDNPLVRLELVGDLLEKLGVAS